MWFIVLASLSTTVPPVTVPNDGTALSRQIQAKEWLKNQSVQPQTPTTFPKNITMPIPEENKNP